MAFLQVESGELGGQRFEIGAEPLTIGRTEDNQIVLDDAEVSSHHCQVVQEGGLFRIEDLESTNGTLLNNVQVKRSFLQNGDEIGVGTVTLTYRVEQEDRAEQPAEVEAEPQEVEAEPQKAGETIQRAGGEATLLFRPRRRKNRALLPVVLVVVVCVATAAAFFLHRLFSY